MEALIKQAMDLRRDHKDPLAYPLLKKAHELGSTPRTAAQLGLLEINLGYWLDAERHLSESLAAKKDVWVHQNRVVIEQHLERARRAIGEVIVGGTPPGAEVEVNGNAAGTLPMQAPVRLGEGPARVEVRAPGFETRTESLSVVGGQKHELAVALVPLAVPPASVAGPPAEATIKTPADATATAPWLRPAAWTAAGLAAGSVVFATFQTRTWFDKSDAFDSHLPTMPAVPPGSPDCGAKDPDRGGPGCAAIYEDMQSARTRAIIGYAAGALLAGGAVTMFVLSNRASTESSLACAPSPRLDGAQCRLTF